MATIGVRMGLHHSPFLLCEYPKRAPFVANPAVPLFIQIHVYLDNSNFECSV